MADLNALIAQGVQFQAPPNPFAQYAQMQQLQQSDQANQLNQMKMEEMRADAEQRNALRRLNPSDPGYEAQLSKLNPSLGIAYRKDRNAASSAETKLIADKLALLPEAYRMADTPEAYYRLHESIHSDPVLGPWLNSVGATKEQGLAKIQQAVSTGTFDKLRMGSMQSANQVLESMKPIVAAPSASVYDPTTGTFKQAPAAPEKAAPPKLHVVGKNLVDETGKVVFKAPAEPGAGLPKAPPGYRVTATGDLEAIPGGPATNKPMTDLQKQAYKKDFAADTYKIKSAVDTAAELEKLTDDLVGNSDKGVKPHPGLRGITGYAGLLPSLPSGDAVKAEQKLETFKGKIKALGRSIASQDGKLGNMAVQEWQFISDAVQAINPRAGNLDEQMRDVVRQAKQLANNMRGKFDLTYEDATPTASASAPKPAGGGALSPAEEAELAQLRKRFGK